MVKTASAEHHAQAQQSPPVAAQMDSALPSQDVMDSDGDLIPNSFDAFPHDPQRAFRIVLPEDDFLTVAYQDDFPRTGDNDYNDFVVRYQVVEVRNARNQVTDIIGTVEPVMLKAAYDHKFVIGIGLGQAQGSLTIENTDHAGNVTKTRTQSVDGVANITVYESTRSAFSLEYKDIPTGTRKVRHPYYNSYVFLLTNPIYEAQLYGHRADFVLSLDTPQSSDSIDQAPYDPYIIVNHEQAYDIHLPGKQALPNTHNPSSAPENFRNSNGFPWALLVPTDWLPPKEGLSILIAYPKFDAWRSSHGASDSDWYLDAADTQVAGPSAKLIDGPSFPDMDPTNSSYLDAMNWNISAGAQIGTCNAPQIMRVDGNSILNAEAWQDFLLCLFGKRINPFYDMRKGRLNHISFTEKQSALTYVYLIHDRFSLSQSSGLSSLEKLKRLYQALTFRRPSQIDSAKLQEALAASLAAISMYAPYTMALLSAGVIIIMVN